MKQKKTRQKLLRGAKSGIILFFLVLMSFSASSDPIDVTLSADADARVRRGKYGNNNYGSEEKLIAKDCGNNYSRKSYIRFDLSSYPNPVNSATLRLKVHRDDGAPGVKCSMVNGSWDESTITWNNAPASGDLINTVTSIPGAEEWFELDITDEVNTKLGGEISILMEESPADCDGVVFYSKEYETADDHPQLVINLELPPSAPSNLSAVAGDGQVELDWDNNGEDDLEGYNVYRSTTSGSGYAKINGVLLADSEYTDNTVTNGTTYYYVVTAVDNADIESVYSGEASATPQPADVTPPAVPSNPELSVENGDIVINWDDNNEVDLAGYNVYRSTNHPDDYAKINGSIVTNSEYTDSDVSEGTTYYYKISAEDDSGNESDQTSEALSATPSGQYGVLIVSATNEGTTIIVKDASEMESTPEGKELVPKVFDITPTGNLEASALCFSVPASDINEKMEVNVVRTDDNGATWDNVPGATVTKTGDTYKVCVPNIDDFSIWALATSYPPAVPISNYSVFLLVVLIGAALLLSKRFKFFKKAVR